jgi:DNA-binding transcriptional regulator YiaG
MTSPRNPTSLLIESGRALYGPIWQSALARDLGVSDRTVRRWAAGANIPRRVYADLLLLAQERGRRLDALCRKLKEAAP